MGNAIDISTDELQLVKQFILLPVALDVLERDIQLLQRGGFKLSDVYIATFKHLQASITRELTEIRKEMRQRGIKVYDLRSSSKGIVADYLCRGYHHHISFMPALIRTETVLTLCRLLGMDVATLGGVKP